MNDLPLVPAEPQRDERALDTAGSLSQWQLIGRRFAQHRLAVASAYFLIVVYVTALFAEFFAPYPSRWRDLEHAYSPPQRIRLSWSEGLHVYEVRQHVDPVTLRKTFVEDPNSTVPLTFLTKGEPYALWGLVPWDRHFLGVDLASHATRLAEADLHDAEPTPSPPTFYLLGADRYGRDIASRILYGARISLSVGVLGIAITLVLGLAIGGVSGYLGGAVDTFIQRSIEIAGAFPRVPLWLALAAAMPPEWSPLRVYFAITIVLSLLGWPGLARVVRGKILALREEEYAMAARLIGAGHGRIIFRHLLPGFTSHIIVTLTMSVPGMILGETSLSFLGLGLRPPIVSWGVMLQDCMNMTAVAKYPWLLLPALFVVVTVLGFNFMGDGLRDAADPYGAR